MVDPDFALKRFIDDEGLTLDEVVVALRKRGFRTTKATLSRIQNRRIPVSLDLLPHLSEITGIPPEDLRPELAKIFAGRLRQKAGAPR